MLTLLGAIYIAPNRVNIIIFRRTRKKLHVSGVRQRIVSARISSLIYAEHTGIMRE